MSNYRGGGLRLLPTRLVAGVPPISIINKAVAIGGSGGLSEGSFDWPLLPLKLGFFIDIRRSNVLSETESGDTGYARLRREAACGI